MPLILVALARQRTPIGQFEIALAALQGLDRWLLVNGQDQRVFRRIEIKPNDFGGFRRKVGVVTFAPAFAGRKVDLL